MFNTVQSRMRQDFGPNETIHACVRDGNISELRLILSNATLEDIEKVHNIWGTPLHVAVFCDSLPAVDMLLDAGADPLALSCNEVDYHPLFTAARIGTWVIVERLWRRVHPETCEKKRDAETSCLAIAARYGHAHIIGMLLDAWDGWPMGFKEAALFAAIFKWRVNVVDLLLEKVTFPQDVILCALHHAIDFIPMLAEDERSGVPCGGVDYLNQQRLIEHLIKAGADPNAQLNPGKLGRYRQTFPILQVCRSVDLVGGLKSLLENGADPDIQDSDGKTTLHYLGTPVLIKRFSPKCCLNETGIRLLLEKRANVCQRDNQGNTPLHYAAYGSNLYIFCLFVSAMDLEEQKRLGELANMHGETLLHWAAAGGKLDIVEYLISHGADVNKVSVNGWTALTCSLTPSHDGAICNTGRKVKKSWVAIRGAQILLAHGANPLVLTEEKWSPLHCLAMHLDSDEGGEASKLADELIDRGVDVEACAPMVFFAPGLGEKDTNIWGWRAKEILERYSTDSRFVRHALPLLHWAVHNGAVGVTKSILAHGANTTCPDSNGMYPATTLIKSVRMQRNLEVSKKVIDLLIKAGVDT